MYSTSSSDQVFFYLLTSCFIAVKKPWGLKNPVNQNEGGLSHLEIQRLSWAYLSRSPLIQPERDAVNQEISAPVGSYWNFLGTLKSNTALMESTMSGVILMEPSIASHIAFMVVLTMVRIDPNLYNSCPRKILRGTRSILPGSPRPFGPLVILSFSLISTSM